jgi:hypothetical protein
MTNVEFIATYIFNHPGARHGEIMSALRSWRGIDEYDVWGKRNTWGRQYFNRWGSDSNVYLDTHWRSIVPGKPRSGYILTPKGMSKVRERVEDFSFGSSG